MWPFTCNHPANRLHVKKMHSKRPPDTHPTEATIYTYHLYCQSCMKEVDIEFAHLHREIQAANINKELGNR